MALAALICAYRESDDAAGGLRATLALAGRTLLERQVRIAARAGASPIVVLVERVPADLLAAIDRLRAEVVPVTIARTAAQAAEAVGPDDRLLIFADGALADQAQVSRLLGGGGPALLTLPDSGADDRFERIDAQTRWAGLALLDGVALRQTAAMLEDWDLQSTLLRRAVQEGARQIAVRGHASEVPIVIAEQQSDLHAVQSRILEGSSGAREDWVSRYLLAPIEASAARALLPTSLTPAWLFAGAGVLTGLGAILLGGGWLWFGGVMLLLATPLDGIAERLAALRLQPGADGSWPARILPYLAAAAVLALSYRLAIDGGWGCLALAIGALTFLLALSRETREQRLPERLFFAERKGMAWAMLPFAAAGAWITGLAALALYAAASFFWAQHEVHRSRTTREQD